MPPERNATSTANEAGPINENYFFEIQAAPRSLHNLRLAVGLPEKTPYSCGEQQVTSDQSGEAAQGNSIRPVDVLVIQRIGDRQILVDVDPR